MYHYIIMIQPLSNLSNVNYLVLKVHRDTIIIMEINTDLYAFNFDTYVNIVTKRKF